MTIASCSTLIPVRVLDLRMSHCKAICGVGLQRLGLWGSVSWGGPGYKRTLDACTLEPGGASIRRCSRLPSLSALNPQPIG